VEACWQTPVKLPKRQQREYERPPLSSQSFVPLRYATGPKGHDKHSTS